jgi:hypothetical protein
MFVKTLKQQPAWALLITFEQQGRYRVSRRAQVIDQMTDREEYIGDGV